ncbi:hypothetical protein [Nocardioides sp. zg-DK7169]|uniref:hypothetical protein n=1 Tax=Nocardioides sp. zg-DK7169 TaxID=2736600 RepID=UPI0015555B28|nr:hypothetical protein [Nocardioides sp. zg-DK7169]NPC97332.1 hypothetical protein [Nocardioides sp. zg-DK7169]
MTAVDDLAVVANEMNPGSFEFGAVWWAGFIAVVAFSVVAIMGLFLWQAVKEPAARPAHAEPRRTPAPSPFA